jgi:hypothetical protein
MGFLRFVFDDKRFTVALLITWMCIACIVFYKLGAFHMKFMAFGPSENTLFMGMIIDTWEKWYCLAIFSFTNTATNEFLGTALVPWFQNTIQDHKSKYLPYSKATCMAIIMAYDVYTHVMSIFGIYLLFSQIDFLIIRCVADVLITFITTTWFMQNKVTDSERYRSEVQHTDMSNIEEAKLMSVVEE